MANDAREEPRGSSPPERVTPRKRRRVLIALALVGSTAVGLAAAEIVLRALGHRPRIFLGAETVEGRLWVADARLGFRNRAHDRFENEVFGSVVTTGAFGERRGAGSPGEGAPVVLFVGDSTTFCAEVGDDETGPAEVAKRVARPDLAFVNAGVRGYNTVQAKRLAEEWLARASVRLVVYTYCDNDYTENLDPTAYWPARAPAVRIARDGSVETIEVPYPGPDGEALAVLESPRREATPGGLLREGMRRSALVAGVADLVGYGRLPPLAARPSPTPESFRRAEEEGAQVALERLLSELSACCSARGARLLVTRFTTSTTGWYPWLTVPAHPDHDPRERLARACRAASVECLDPSAGFPEDPRSYLAPRRDGRLDPHYGRSGTRAYGEALAPRVAAILEGR